MAMLKDRQQLLLVTQRETVRKVFIIVTTPALLPKTDGEHIGSENYRNYLYQSYIHKNVFYKKTVVSSLAIPSVFWFGSITENI